MSDTPILVLRIGETFLKGRNRPRFHGQLQTNVARSIAPLGHFSLAPDQGRLFVRGDGVTDEHVLRRVEQIPGVQSFSAAFASDRNLSAVVEASCAAVTHHLKAQSAGTFAVRAQRGDKSFAHNSMEIERAAGAEVRKRTGLKVDLKTPDVTVGIEVAHEALVVYTDRRPGVGGLPVGTAGRALLLLSGGIDSPVAGHLLQKRGCTLTCIHFESPPYTSERARDKVEQLAQCLAVHQDELQLLIVPFTAAQKAIRASAPAESVVVLCRRMMMRIASRFALMHRCAAIGSGENLSQVASQTLANLACIEATATYPILRPLLCYDKEEIITVARWLGTFEISILPYPDCCTLFIPKHPSTGLPLKVAEKAESKLDIEGLVDEAVEKTETTAFASARDC